jgi:hypothetical protein
MLTVPLDDYRRDAALHGPELVVETAAYELDELALAGMSFAQHARQAVALTFAQIMAERYPGTRWLPVGCANGHAASRAGKLVPVLSAPNNLDPIRDPSTTAPNVDNVDARCEQPLALSGA